MTFALVWWTQTNEFSVVPLKDTSKTGKKTKWGKVWYPTKVLKQSENREWLESLEVATNGEIITPKRRSSMSSDLLLKRRVQKESEKTKKMKRTKVGSSQNSRLLEESPIFNERAHKHQQVIVESDEGESIENEYTRYSSKIEDSAKNREWSHVQCKKMRMVESDGDESSDEEKNKDLRSPDAFDESDGDGDGDGNTSGYDTFKNEKNTDDRDGVSYCSDDGDNDEVSVENHANVREESEQGELKKNLCYCRLLPKISEQDIDNLKKVLELAASIHVAQHNLDQNKAQDVMKPTAYCLDGKIELVAQSGVMVDEYTVRSIQISCKKNPREMVRKLMKVIIGEDILKESSPTGKNGRTPIPVKVYEAVLRFVNGNVAKEKYMLSNLKYRETLTALCAGLRNVRQNKSSALAEKNSSVQRSEEIQKAEEVYKSVENTYSMKEKKDQSELFTLKRKSSLKGDHDVKKRK